MYNKQQYKNVRHQATRRAQKWLKKLRHLDAIQVLFVSVANESPVSRDFIAGQLKGHFLNKGKVISTLFSLEYVFPNSIAYIAAMMA